MRLRTSSRRSCSERPAVARIGTINPCIRSPARSAGSGSSPARRIRCIREREAHSRTPSSSARRGPDSAKDPGLLFFNFQPAKRPAAATQRSTGSHTGDGDLLFQNLPQDDASTGWPIASCKHADVAQQAERDHAMVQATSSILVIRSTIHFGCVLALRGRTFMVLAVRDVRGRRPEAPCSETPCPTGRSRLGTAEVNCKE